jgi:phosphoglycerate transport regulatory protein PgtC
MLTFDSDRSSSRTAVVDTLFDQLISFQLDNLKSASRAVNDATQALGDSPSPDAVALLDEAKALIAAMPVTEEEASSEGIRAAFTGGDEKTARQAELEQQWASFASGNYANAKAKAEEAAALAN